MAKVSFMANGKRVSFITKSSKSRKKKGSGQKTRKSKRARSRKSNKPRRSTSRSMPRKRRKSSRRRSPGKRSFIDRIPILKNPTVQKIGFGLGMGVIVVEGIRLLSRFGPPQIAQPLQQNAGIIKLGVELATEPLSAVFDVVTNPQMLSQITGRLGGGGNGMQSSGANMVGFA